MNDAIIQYNRTMKFLIIVRVRYGVFRLVENRKRICLFDIPKHCILCPGSGSVHTAQMNSIVLCKYKALEIFHKIWWWFCQIQVYYTQMLMAVCYHGICQCRWVQVMCGCWFIAADDDDVQSPYVTAGYSCSSNQFQCVSSGYCIYKSRVCDSNCDCSDCSDECGKSVCLLLIFQRLTERLARVTQKFHYMFRFS